MNTRDGADERGLARPVRADNGRDRALLDVKRHAIERLRVAVKDVEVFDAEHHAPARGNERSLPPCGGGLGRGVAVTQTTTTPTPNPSPQGGGEQAAVCGEVVCITPPPRRDTNE